MAPRLKVFVTSDGLTDYIVAATSRAKALAAWGVRQDVFKEGGAHETDDAELVAAAAARPGEVLRRPAATRAELGRIGAAKQKPAKLAPARPPPEPKGPSKAALKKVADLEARLADLDAADVRAREAIARERAELDRKAEAQAAETAAKRQKLAAALSAARQALGSPPADSGRS
jgi:hypothetical protein